MRTLTKSAFVAFLATILTGCSGNSLESVAPPVVRANPTLVVIGDSISTGAAASGPDKGYVALLTKRLTGHSLINCSRGGWSVHATRDYVEPAYIGGVAALWPNSIVIVLGTNDFSVSEPLEEFRAGYRALLDRLLRALVDPLGHLFCVTPFPRLDEDRANTAGHVLDDYRLVVQEECSMARGIPLDGSQAVPAAVAYFSDTIHPNDRGHASIAAWLLEQLRAHGVGRR